MIGSEKSSHSVSIYRNYRDSLAEISTPYLLSRDYFQKYTIAVTHGMCYGNECFQEQNEKSLPNIPAGFIRVYLGSDEEPIIEAINLQPIFINYILLSGKNRDENSFNAFYLDCEDVEEKTSSPIMKGGMTTETPRKNKASSHGLSLACVASVIYMYVLFQLLLKNRWI